MQTLERKPVLTVKREFMLDEQTKISMVNVTARTMMKISNNKALTNEERGAHIIASKILVNGQPIVTDDLLDKFTEDEFNQISEFVYPELKDKKEISEKNA